MRQTRGHKRFTISEVAADWHELTIPQRTMRSSIVRAFRQQLDLQFSMQTYYRLKNSALHYGIFASNIQET